MDYTALSKELSYALRHAPEKYGLTLDSEGFADLAQLLSAVNTENRYGREVSRADVEHVIEISEKKRLEISGGRIRAFYGHSTSQQMIEKAPSVPPDVLWHGTSSRFIGEILREGLKAMSRQYVHLSADTQTALDVGRRHGGKTVLLKIDAAAAHAGGVEFFRGNDKVWLCRELPAEYFTVCG